MATQSTTSPTITERMKSMNIGKIALVCFAIIGGLFIGVQAFSYLFGDPANARGRETIERSSDLDREERPDRALRHQGPSRQGSVGDNCVDVGNGKAKACMVVRGQHYRIIPADSSQRTLEYNEDCAPRGQNEYVCNAPGILTSRLFVHRPNGRFFGTKAPQANARN